VRRIVGLAIVTALLVGAVWIGLTLSRVLAAASALRADLFAAQYMVGVGLHAIDPTEATDLLRATRTDLVELESAARPFLWTFRLFGWIPRYGPLVEAAPALLDLGLHLTAAGGQAIETLSPLLAEDPGQRATDETAPLEAVAEMLTRIRPHLVAARATISEVEEARAATEVEELHPRVRGWMDRLDQYLPALDEGVDASLLLTELMGTSGPRTYLILVQNEDELRATGGFISGVARVTIEGGQLQDLQFEDSYAIDDFSRPYPDPPAPLKEIMLIDLWVFRDSNWSPDFPTSARSAIELYALGRSIDADGVVALDQQAIRTLIGALGPLRVEGWDEPVTGRTVVELARQAWEPEREDDPDWWEHRKDFMGIVLDAAVEQVQGSMDQEKLVRLAYATREAIHQRHIMLYLADHESAAVAADLGWNGALRESPGDYLMVVDTNVGYNKVNALIEESLEYTVDLTDLEEPRARLIVHHRHPAEQGESPCRHEPRYDATYEQMTRRCYWDYLRVYVPSGAQLVAATPHTVAGSELASGQERPAQVTTGPPEHGRHVYATLFLLRPQETLETRFETILPKGVVLSENDTLEYNLLVQKQPGTQASPLRVEVRLPSGKELVTSEPSPTSVEGTNLEYELTLETDQALSVVFR
jgi:hypothetical protein